MGNGYFSKAEYLYSYIEAGDTARAADLVKNNRELLNNVLTHDSRATALGRSVWRGNHELCGLLLGMGSDPDTLSNGLTPLMIACLRNHAGIVQLLLEYKASIEIKNNEDLTALDFAILYGNYSIARKLTKKFAIKPQLSAEQYKAIANKKRSYYVNYVRLLDALDKDEEYETFPELFERPVSTEVIQAEPKLNDPVIDPNETWKNFISRVSQFEPPPLVERSSLPWSQQPQNRLLGRFHYVIEKMKGDTLLSLHPKDKELEELPSNRRQLNDTDV